jgi:hypothetical protein
MRNVLTSLLIGAGMVFPSITEGDDNMMKYFAKVAKIKYVNDDKAHGKSDYWQTPEETERLGTGDCEDYALYLYDLLKKDGYNPYLVLGKGSTSAPYNHAWLEMQIDDNPDDDKEGEWYVVDPQAGAIYRAKNLDNDRYVPIVEFEYFQKFVSEYKERAGLTERITKHYDGGKFLEEEKALKRTLYSDYYGNTFYGYKTVTIKPQ